MRYTTVIPTNPLAESLENLGALNGTGFYEVKPFKDWAGVPAWKEKIFKLRLCNAGEIFDITEAADEMNEKARLEHIKLEILSRSIFSVDGRALITDEELTKYNETNETDFKSPREWIAVYLRNLEKIVIDRLDAIYGALTLKQLRFLQGNVVCTATNKMFSKNSIPEGSLFLKYDLGEIITPEGMQLYPNYREMFDVIEPINVPEKIENKSNDSATLTVGETFEERRSKMEDADFSK